MEGVEERDTTEAFSPAGLETEGALSAVLTTGDPPTAAAAAAAVFMAAALVAEMADTGLGCA